MPDTPESLRYSKEHQWARREDNQVVVGITDYAQRTLGDVVFIDLPATGRRVVAGKPLCVIESVKAASDVYSPLSGTLTEINESLRESPEHLNDDPYGTWIFKLNPDDDKELDTLLSASDYEALTQE